MKTRLNDGRDLRRGAIAGTQPGSAETVQDEVPVKRRPNRGRFKPAVAPDPPAEWDNPYIKRKMSKGEALHLAALRKSRELAASDPGNPVDRVAIIKRDDSRCWICKKPVSPRDIELDHVVPLVRGGKHTPENLRVACKSCNAWHGDRLVQPL